MFGSLRILVLESCEGFFLWNRFESDDSDDSDNSDDSTLSGNATGGASKEWKDILMG
jgi:hypothetical protein